MKDLYDGIVVQPDKQPMPIFNKIISEVAIIRQKSNDNHTNNEQNASFILKDGIEFKNISAINSINTLKILMNNEISKNPDKLLNIPKFEPEESFSFFNNEDVIDSSDLKIRLKEFLLTPTVLSIVYQTLRGNDDHHKIVLNDHLAMNNELNAFESKIIQYNSNLINLISQMKRIVFNYKVDDENQNATIENNLTKKDSIHLSK